MEGGGGCCETASDLNTACGGGRWVGGRRNWPRGGAPPGRDNAKWVLLRIINGLAGGRGGEMGGGRGMNEQEKRATCAKFN